MIVKKCNDTWSINRWTGLPSEVRLSVSLQVFLNTKQIVGDFCRHLVNVNPNSQIQRVVWFSVKSIALFGKQLIVESLTHPLR